MRADLTSITSIYMSSTKEFENFMVRQCEMCPPSPKTLSPLLRYKIVDAANVQSVRASKMFKLTGMYNQNLDLLLEILSNRNVYKRFLRHV